MSNKKNIINQKGEKNLAVQDSVVYITVSIYDEIERLVSEGKIYEVADKIKYLHDFVGTKHPFYPHYKYKPVKFDNTTVLKHEPNTAEAYKIYPLSYRGQFSIANENEERNVHQLLNDAYFKQQEIEIDMKSITTWLGDQKVETSNLDKVIKDGKWVISPPALPEPLKLKLYIKGEQDIPIIDYLEMGICGKEDKYILLSNSEQENEVLLVTLKIPLKWNVKDEYVNMKKMKIGIQLKTKFESEVRANHYFLRTIKLISEENGVLTFKNLVENKDSIIVSNFNFDISDSDLEKDICFLKRLYKIENHYGIKFTIPETMNDSDWEAINILEHAMEEKPITKRTKKLTADFNNMKEIYKFIDLFDNEEVKNRLMIQQSGPDAQLKLFDVVVPIAKIKTVYNSLKITDIERVKSKVQFMDEGENIKISLESGDDAIFNEYYYFK